MSIKKTFMSQKELHDLLNSDDELPTTYNEVKELPAYKDDNRFNHILRKYNKTNQLQHNTLNVKPDKEQLSYLKKSEKRNLTISNPILDKNNKAIYPPHNYPYEKSAKDIHKTCSVEKDNINALKQSLVTDKKIVLQPGLNHRIENINSSINVTYSSNINNLIAYSCNSKESLTHDNAPPRYENRLLFHKGNLQKRDLVCIKGIESTQNKSVLIWFINYVILKDMQSYYTCPSSCLVGNWMYSENYCNIDNESHDEFKSNFEVIIKYE